MKNKQNIFITLLWWLFTGIVIIITISASFELFKVFGKYSISSKNELFFFIGFIAYLVVHFLFYKPVLIHVMAHELTHALIGMVFGAKSNDIHIAKEGGSVKITKTNFLISLSPYFVPLYALIFCWIFSIADVKYKHWLALVTGVCVAFHFALTLYSMKVHQPDLSADSNFVFSIFFILLMNMVFAVLIFSVISNKIVFWDFLKAAVLGSAGILKFVFIKISELGSRFSPKLTGGQ